MKQLILNRIKQMSENTGGFPKNIQRWGTFQTYLVDERHLSELTVDDLNKLEDSTLLNLFERILKRYHTQM